MDSVPKALAGSSQISAAIPLSSTSGVQTEGISEIAKGLAKSVIREEYELVDTVEALPAFIALLLEQPTKPSPSLFLDLEGVKLSRQGTISILQIHLAPLNKSYLVDIHTLGLKAFDTAYDAGNTLRSVLQSSTIPKVFFDVRNDSDALYSHFQVSLAGVIDVQVMEYATRNYAKRFVSGLSKCIETDLNLSLRQRLECQRIKERGLKLFAPERGGSYEVFNTRPLSDAIGAYCVQDVQWLPALYEVYLSKVTKSVAVKIAAATIARVKESQSASYVGHGRQKAFGPW